MNDCNPRLTGLYLHSFTCPNLDEHLDDINREQQSKQNKSNENGQLGPK
jgi:hypothetical protein